MWIHILSLLVCTSSIYAYPDDNHATETIDTPSIMEPLKDGMQKVTEKRAPVHLTAVAGMNQPYYNNYNAYNNYPNYPYKYYYDTSKSSATSAAKPTYPTSPYYMPNSLIPYNPNPAPIMLFMGTQHPSGYMMLIPLMLPQQMLGGMFNYFQPQTPAYYPQVYPQSSYVQPVIYPTKTYSTADTTGSSSYSQSKTSSNPYSHLSQNAGFTAQQQLVYSGPYSPRNAGESQSSESLITSAVTKPDVTGYGGTSRVRDVDRYLQKN